MTSYSNSQFQSTMEFVVQHISLLGIRFHKFSFHFQYEITRSHIWKVHFFNYMKYQMVNEKMMRTDEQYWWELLSPKLVWSSLFEKWEKYFKRINKCTRKECNFSRNITKHFYNILKPYYSKRKTNLLTSQLNKQNCVNHKFKQNFNQSFDIIRFIRPSILSTSAQTFKVLFL